MKNIFIILLISVFSLNANTLQKSPNELITIDNQIDEIKDAYLGQFTYEVSDELAACYGQVFTATEKTSKCIQVRENDTQEWKVFDEVIKGFKHEGGKYQIVVSKYQYDYRWQPTDISSIYYVLDNISSIEEETVVENKDEFLGTFKYEVAKEMGACYGSVFTATGKNSKCLTLRENDSSEWFVFDEILHGFDHYKEGTQYYITISKYRYSLNNQPTDISSVYYVLESALAFDVAIPIEPIEDTLISNHTFIVSDKKTDCFQNAIDTPYKTTCKQVKENENDQWTTFKDVIKGFNYVEGNKYVINVSKYRYHPKLQPTDISSIYYTLDKVVSTEVITGNVKIDIPNRTAWNKLKINISGFKYRTGFSYYLLVKKQLNNKRNPYKLVKVITQTPTYNKLQKVLKSKKTLYVASKKTSCYINNVESMCYKIKRNLNDSWRIYKKPIINFKYEVDNDYLIKAVNTKRGLAFKKLYQKVGVLE